MKQAFILLLSIFLAWPSISRAASEEELLRTAKSRFLAIEERKRALDELKSVLTPEAIAELGQMIRSPEENIIIRSHASGILVESAHPWASTELKKLLKDSSAPSEGRTLALYALWKKNPEEIRSEMISLAQNSREPVELRSSALSYLSQLPGDWPSGFWSNLFRNKANPTPIRLMALSGMKELGLLNGHKDILSQVIQNEGENLEFRKGVIVKAQQVLDPSEFEQELLSIISNPNNALELRRFAVANLAVSINPTSQSAVKEILHRERDPILVKDLEELLLKQS